MTYGLSIFPLHDYVVDVEPLDGDIRAIRAVDQSDDGGMGSAGAGSGRPVNPEHVPTRMQWLDRRHHAMPDFDRAHLLNVSKRARDLIEAVEPGVHQFLPVTYVDVDGKFLEDRFFLMVGNRLDSIDRKHTTMVLSNGRMWIPAIDLVRMNKPLPPGADPNVPAKFVFSREQIGGRHLWMDKHMSAGPWLSDELAERLIETGMTGLRLSESKAETI